MSQTVLLKRSSVSGVEPSTLEEGELAVNLSDLLLFIGTSTGVKTFPMSSGSGSVGVIDGGSAASVYLPAQSLDGGTANG